MSCARVKHYSASSGVIRGLHSIAVILIINNVILTRHRWVARLEG